MYEVKRNNKCRTIVAITEASGESTTSLPKVAMEFIEHFHNLLETTAQCDELDISTLQSGPCLTDAQQQELVRQIASEEIRDALMDIGNDRAPWPNGYGAEFSR